MTRLLIIAALFCFAVPAALAAPPASKGKPESSEASSQTVEKNVAKACKAERTRIGVQPFNDKYGTNANKKNAFGKCVSKLAKQQGSSS